MLSSFAQASTREFALYSHADNLSKLWITFDHFTKFLITEPLTNDFMLFWCKWSGFIAKYRLLFQPHYSSMHGCAYTTSHLYDNICHSKRYYNRWVELMYCINMGQYKFECTYRKTANYKRFQESKDACFLLSLTDAILKTTILTMQCILGRCAPLLCKRD